MEGPPPTPPRELPPNGHRCVACGVVTYQPPATLVEAGECRRATHCIRCGAEFGDEGEPIRKKARGEATEEQEFILI